MKQSYVACLYGLAEECKLLISMLSKRRLDDRPDLNKELTDASMALAGIYNKLRTNEPLDRDQQT